MNSSNKYILFSGMTKMADVILMDYRVLDVLPRFDMRLGFGEKNVSEVCAKHGVNEHFFLLTCNIHTFDDFFPDKKDLVGVDVVSMVKYLKNSHDYYINHRIASIEQKLGALKDCQMGAHYQIICRFFAQYHQEVLNHFEYEENTVFPNITALEKGEKVDFQIDIYEKNHDNIDDKLNDLKNIMIKYLPDSCSTEKLNGILTDIFLFEEDLTKHTRIENKILIPFVKEMERAYEKR